MTNEFLRQLCSSLPGCTEDVKWGNDLCFCVKEKMFCVTSVEGDFHVSFKCDAEDFTTLIEKHDIIPAPYLARNKWVLVEKGASLSKKEWDHFIRKSYHLVVSRLSKKAQKELGI